MNDDEICEIVITAPDADWLLSHTRQLVEARLVACGHHQPIRSIYTWEAAIHDEQETRVALHTRTSHVQAVIAATQQTHPYAVPCIISLPISQASDTYKAWVLAVTAGNPETEPANTESGNRRADL